MKTILIACVLSAFVSGTVSWLMRPKMEDYQEFVEQEVKTELEEIEKQLDLLIALEQKRKEDFGDVAEKTGEGLARGVASFAGSLLKSLDKEVDSFDEVLDKVRPPEDTEEKSEQQ